jgi:uncharacterized metal-binding protein YceD (DUF177 family)
MDAYGNDMDTQLLVKDLIILNMPLRVLCSEECKDSAANADAT